MGMSSKILEMSKSQFLSNDQIQALKETSFHSNILKFKEKNLDFKNLSSHGKISQKAKIIKDLIYSGEFWRQVLVISFGDMSTISCHQNYYNQSIVRHSI